ncbi:hypothetical protein DFJ74DRAFT_33009 [Hyaloraphidium curvatum]|nr:hypothetical protein DFJ74DRAFT_33009 [Hyaloraphidium curvatum]
MIERLAEAQQLRLAEQSRVGQRRRTSSSGTPAPSRAMSASAPLWVRDRARVFVRHERRWRTERQPRRSSRPSERPMRTTCSAAWITFLDEFRKQGPVPGPDGVRCGVSGEALGRRAAQLRPRYAVGAHIPGTPADGRGCARTRARLPEPRVDGRHQPGRLRLLRTLSPSDRVRVRDAGMAVGDRKATDPAVCGGSGVLPGLPKRRGAAGAHHGHAH